MSANGAPYYPSHAGQYGFSSNVHPVPSTSPAVAKPTTPTTSDNREEEKKVKVDDFASSSDLKKADSAFKKQLEKVVLSVQVLSERFFLCDLGIDVGPCFLIRNANV